MLMECDNAERWHLTRGARWGLWGSVLLSCLLFGGVRIWQNHQRALVMQAWEAQAPNRHQAGYQLFRRLSQLSTASPKILRTELEQAINGGKPFTGHSNGRVAWNHAPSGVQFGFNFDKQGRFTDVVCSSGNAPPPSPPHLDLLTDSVCTALSRHAKPPLGPLLWMILTAGCLFLWRHRSPLADVMLAMAIIWLTAWLVTPGYPWLSRRVTNDDNLVWAIAMFSISILAIVTTRIRPAPSLDPLCPTCRYNLTGNQSGTCPECGQRIPKSLRRLIERTPCDSAGSP